MTLLVPSPRRAATPPALRRRFLSTRGLVADDFQARAFDAVDAGSSVLVAAPTGSGKTLVADYAIERALALGRTAVYTTPIKALSNQKLRDLVALHGRQNVGLITGDRSVRPASPVVVMTTEVLRSLLHDESRLLADLGVVVLDEIHYLGDPERGPVWEEVVLTAPAAVQLVGLSATIPDAERVATWMARAHGPTELVVEQVRPVELRHLYALGSPRGEDPFLLPMLLDGAPNPRMDALGPRRRREGVLRNRQVADIVTPTREEMLRVLRDGMLPAIWFVLSRSGCDRAVEEVATLDLQLTGLDEAMALRRLAEEACRPLRLDDRRAVGHEAWLHALERGVAAHHGGMLPVHREVVEAGLRAGLVKVVFATETLAVGVNLPARTVVVDRLTRGGGPDADLLASSTVAQLVGRAGRRGLDRSGAAVIPYTPALSGSHVVTIVGGARDPLRSSFVPTPVLVLGLLERRPAEAIRSFLRRSYAEHERAAALVPLRLEVEARRRDLAHLADLAPQAGADAAPAVAAMTPTSAGRDDVAAALEALVPGSVFVDPGRPADGCRLVVARPRRRRGEVAVDVVSGDARRSVVTARTLRQPPFVVATLDLPDGDGGRGGARAAAALLAALPPTPVVEETRASARTARDLAADHRRRERLAAHVERLEAEIRALEDESDHQLDATVQLLRERGHLDGWAATASGRRLRRLYHRSGPLVAEAIGAGLLDDLDPPGLVAVSSFFTAAAAGRGRGLPTAALAERWRAVVALAEDLAADELRLVGSRTPAPSLGAATALWQWSRSGSLARTLDGYDGGAGDLVREARQVVELLGQIERVIEGDLLDACAAGRASLLTGVVVAGIDHEPWDE